MASGYTVSDTHRGGRDTSRDVGSALLAGPEKAELEKLELTAAWMVAA